jgi:hypothetical protein
MEVSGQLHASGKRPRYPLRSGLAVPQSRPGRSGEKKKKSLPCRESNPGRPPCSLVTTLTKLPQLEQSPTPSTHLQNPAVKQNKAVFGMCLGAKPEAAEVPTTTANTRIPGFTDIAKGVLYAASTQNSGHVRHNFASHFIHFRLAHVTTLHQLHTLHSSE